jgi:predicted DNA-binding protein with PD1-like motif
MADREGNQEAGLKSKVLDARAPKTFAVIFETADEVAAGLAAFANEAHLAASHFTAIGALSSVVLGYFDWQTKKYKRIEIGEQVEVLSCIGDVALENNEPKVHAHMVVGKSDGSAWGGHLLEARVRPTLEVILVESPEHLRKRFDPESGLALIRLE